MINMGNYAEISYSIHLILSLEAQNYRINKRIVSPIKVLEISGYNDNQDVRLMRKIALLD